MPPTLEVDLRDQAAVEPLVRRSLSASRVSGGAKVGGIVANNHACVPNSSTTI